MNVALYASDLRTPARVSFRDGSRLRRELTSAVSSPRDEEKKEKDRERKENDALAFGRSSLRLRFPALEKFLFRPSVIAHVI